VTDLNGSGADRREISVFAAVVIVVTGIILFVSDAGILLSRPLWVDEVIAALIASRPSPVAVLGDLGSGADGGASLFHVGLWTVRAMTGSLAPPLLRLLALACVLMALVLTFAVLRRGFCWPAAAAGALAIGAHGLVIEHSYDARFYGPWLLGCALLAALFSRREVQPTRRNAIALAMAAVAVCTIHFYGIITLTLMTVAVLAAGAPRWRERIHIVRPAAWGLVSLVVVIPLALAQRRAYTVPSWLPDFRPSQLGALLSEFWLSRIPVAAACIIVIATLLRARHTTIDGPETFIRAALTRPGIAALSALALMPLALAALSLIGQPSMLSRYAIPAALVWAPWVAIAVTLLGRWAQRIALIVIVCFWFVGYTRAAMVTTAFAQSTAQHVAAFDEARRWQPNTPVAFVSMHVMYSVLWPARLSDTRAAFVELGDTTFRRWFPDSTAVGQANRGVVLERDLVRVHARRLGFPRMVSHAALDTTAVFFVQGAYSRLPVGFADAMQFVRAMFPRHTIRRLDADLLLLERPVPTTK